MAAFAFLTVKKLAEFNKFATAADFSGITTAVASNGASTAAYGAYFSAKGADNKYLILVQNTNSTANADPLSVTIKAGNGLQGNKDITVSLANGKFSYITVESGRFKNISENDTLKALSSATSGDQVSAKGKIFILGGGTYIKVAVFELP